MTWEEAEQAFEGIGISTPEGLMRKPVEGAADLVIYERPKPNWDETSSQPLPKYETESAFGDKIVFADVSTQELERSTTDFLQLENATCRSCGAEWVSFDGADLCLLCDSLNSCYVIL